MIDRNNPAYDDEWIGTSYAMGKIEPAGYVLENEELIVEVWLRIPGEGLPAEALIEVDEKEDASSITVQSNVALDSDECRTLARALLKAADHLDRQDVPESHLSERTAAT